MNAEFKPLNEITATAIQVLCREIGPANTARFLNQFTSGAGDYTKDRNRLLGEPTVDELITEIERRRAGKDQAAKPARKSRRAPRRPSRKT